MSKRAAGPLLALLRLDRALTMPLHRQLYEELRAAILAERLSPGERLPSTRTLAGELGVSRRTVLDAFLQLFAEGYVEGRVGAGTFVTRVLPEMLENPVSRPAALDPSRVQTAPRLSARFLQQQTALPPSFFRWLKLGASGGAFRIGLPAMDEFPMALWSRLVVQMGRSLADRGFAPNERGGLRQLREAIAGYLAVSRGVRCSPDQVIIVNGSQQAVTLIAQVLLDPGDYVWVEDPGYFGARGALLGAGARLVPVPVDEEGIVVAEGRARCNGARLAAVTPSHQMPLGVTMSLSRRLALLDWARANDAWVVEDDYDSEFRYASRPLAALQGLDTAGRVLYMGTFSKVLFPGLRLGYLVAPPSLVDAITTARLFADMYSPPMEQLLVTEFIQAGHFERHVRRMRSIYAERQGILVAAAQRDLQGLLDVQPAESGMHLVGQLPDGVDDQMAVDSAARHDVRVLALSGQYLLEPAQRGLVLGYAAVPPAEIIEGVRGLQRALN